MFQGAESLRPFWSCRIDSVYPTYLAQAVAAAVGALCLMRLKKSRLELRASSCKRQRLSWGLNGLQSCFAEFTLQIGAVMQVALAWLW